MATALLYDSRFLRHDAGWGHPEQAARLSATLEHLSQQSWFPDLVRAQAPELEREWLYEAHDAVYISRAETVCREGAAYLDTPDVGVNTDSFLVATLAVAAGLHLADMVVKGRVDNGFALMRPPGHHAERGTAMGFCLLNNIALAARYLQKKHGLERILILDWDVHHGNGTQHIFEQDPSVFYISLHQYPHYPGTGSRSEAGEGVGEGATLNCPMFAGASDEDYVRAFQEKVLPAAESFKPDAVLLSAGFDAHAADPLGGIMLSERAFSWMTHRVLEIADKYAQGRLISFLEGGYDLHALPRCVAAHLAGLCGARVQEPVRK